MNQKYELLKEILGQGAVIQEPEQLAGFGASCAAVDKGAPPGLAARPSDEKELQKIIQLANKEDFNLTVTSSTGPHHKGGIAGAEENVLVDLSPLKEILWINRRNRVCMIQPGVTYGLLIKALETENMTISMPLAPRDGKSVLASVMDREPTTWPNKQWDVADPVASTEFIFGTGEFFRTGAAGGPGTLEEQRASGGAQKSSAGPSQTDFHRVVGGAQGTMGIFTWVSLRTELKPSMEKSHILCTDSLDELIGFIYEVQRPWLGEHSFVLNRAALAMLMSAQTNKPSESFSALPSYVCLQNIAGFTRLPEERIAYQEQDIKKIAKGHDLIMSEELNGLAAQDILNAAVSTCGEVDWRCAAFGDCLSLFFLTTLDLAPKLTEIFLGLAKKHNVDENQIGVYVQPVVQNHACHVEFMVPFNPEDEKKVGKIKTLEAEAVKVLAENKAFFSRPYGSAGKVVFKQNPLNYEILKKVKKIFDPKRVLNRGKWGL